MRQRSGFAVLTILVLGVFTPPYTAPAACAVLDAGMAGMHSPAPMQEMHWSSVHPLGGCVDFIACGTQLGLLTARARIIGSVVSPSALPAPALLVAEDPRTPPTPPPRA